MSPPHLIKVQKRACGWSWIQKSWKWLYFLDELIPTPKNHLEGPNNPNSHGYWRISVVPLICNILSALESLRFLLITKPLISWSFILQGIPLEVSSTHELTQITLDYKRECQADDVVESLVSPENSETADVVRCLLNFENKDANTNGNVNGTHAPSLSSSNSSHPTLLFLHVLRLAESGKDINLGRTEWRRKPTLQTHF